MNIRTRIRAKVQQIPFKQIAKRTVKFDGFLTALVAVLSAPHLLQHAYSLSIAAHNGVFGSCLRAVGSLIANIAITAVVLLPPALVLSILTPRLLEMYHDIKAFVLGIPSGLRAIWKGILWLGPASGRAWAALGRAWTSVRGMTKRQWTLVILFVGYLSVVGTAIYFTVPWLLPHRPHFLDKFEFGTLIAALTSFVVVTALMIITTILDALFHMWFKRK